jgi:hypothetical protein
MGLKVKVGRIQKVKEWMQIYEKHQQQCLKEVWNNCLILTFKPKEGC